MGKRLKELSLLWPAGGADVKVKGSSNQEHLDAPGSSQTMSRFHSLHSLASTDEPSSSHQQKECHITERQLKLVEEEFLRVLSIHCPEVRILKVKTNTIALNGPDKEVQSTAAKLDKLVQEILVKRVKLPEDLITFMKSSGAISKYQTRFYLNFRNPVSIEVGKDLVLSSLCSHDLDEALTAVLSDLSVEIVMLQGPAAVPPDVVRIKEILEKAKSEVNRSELKVDVRFIPGPSATTVAKVRLVGYAEHVNKLKDLLNDYLLNEVSAKEVLRLQSLELVDCFDKVLDMLGMKQTNVTLKASDFPHPSLVISGPRRQVQESHKSLSSALARLISDTLVLDGRGALLYFQGDGKVSKELVETSCQVLIREKKVSDLQVLPRQYIRSSLSTPLSGSPRQKSTFLFLGLHRKGVDDAMTKMKDLYQAHCSTKTFSKEDLADFTQSDMGELLKLAETEGLFVQENWFGQGVLTVSGLKAGVNQVMQMLHTIIPLRREMRVKEEENLYPCVAWCILGHKGNWERLPKTANYDLENHNVMKGIVDTRKTMWSVDLQNMEALKPLTGQKAKLKRLQNLPDFTLPLYWDNMATSENLKEVVLGPSSEEYQSVQRDFHKTVLMTVVKIERLQNVHLRRVYELQKKQLSEKNKQDGGAGERLLYHGTSQDSCESIKKKGFNRSFSGKNATAYGQGTYFAVNANYSASRIYSKPAADGTQAMFVARVLTGVYTQGQSNMKVPPLRNSQQPHDRYDSLVDRMDNPSMFIVFHDDQACPDYLITFR